MDFSADVLTKILNPIEKVTTWKIEGRKKSPHYVYYATKAYQLLRDDPKQKKQAMRFLDYALGRDFSHYNLLTQRKFSPLDHTSETGSGLFIGRVKNPVSPYIVTRESLMPLDLLRIGFEDDTFHTIEKVTRAVPKKGKFFLSKQKRARIKKGTPVYLIDRRGSELSSRINPLLKMLDQMDAVTVKPAGAKYNYESNSSKFKKTPVKKMEVFRGRIKNQNHQSETGIWISSRNYTVPVLKSGWAWLDPVLFPDDEPLCKNAIGRALKKGVRHFVLNAIWQISLFHDFKNLDIWAGPFCNITNTIAIDHLRKNGFNGVIISPELDKKNILSLPAKSSLPLGVVIYGNWPLGISRIVSDDLALAKPFSSPKGEQAWVSKQNSNYAIYPNWLFDIREYQNLLVKSGYSLFVQLNETIPKKVTLKKRPGFWNWNLSLL
jgi:putative protease